MRKSVMGLLFATIVVMAGCDPNTTKFLSCVIQHESANEPDPVSAQNPTSTASGLFQFLDSTWQSQANRYGIRGYSKAKHAPAEAQIYVAYRTVEDGGKSHWNGTGC